MFEVFIRILMNAIYFAKVPLVIPPSAAKKTHLTC